MEVLLGTTGWGYSFWKGGFYPKKVRSMLTYYSTKSPVVEINSTYYSVPSDEIIEKWNAQTPSNFMFFAKMNQEVTHSEKGLPHKMEQLASFIGKISKLEKLKGVLFQFPYTFTHTSKNEITLREMIMQSGNPGTLIVEVRHKSWFSSETLQSLIEEEKLVLAASSKIFESLDMAKNQKVNYVRILGSRKEFPDHLLGRKRKDKSQELDRWADIISEFSGELAFVFVNNRFSGNAADDAQKLHTRLAERGIKVQGFKPSPSLEDFL